MVFGSIVNECYVNKDSPELLCIFNENESACSYGIAVGVIAFFGCIFFFVVDLYFQQISSVKDRKRAVLLDLGFSGTSPAVLCLRRTMLAPWAAQGCCWALQLHASVLPSPPTTWHNSCASVWEKKGGRWLVPSSHELRGSSEEAGVWQAGDSGVSCLSVSLLQPETFTELGSVGPPREVRLGGCISETRRGVLPSHISCFWLKQMLFHQLHLGLFSLCACGFWNKAETRFCTPL